MRVSSEVIRFPVLLLAGLLALSSAGLHPALAAESGALRPVVTEIVTRGAPAPGRFTGTVEATTTVGVAFELLGRLVSRPAEEGMMVRRGDELARIDSRSLEDDRDAAQAEVGSLEATLATVTRARQRAIELAGRGVAAASSLEIAERNETVARANLEQARATLARAEDALSRAVLRAPFDGVVIETRHEPGTTVAAGDPVLILASPGGRNVRLTLPVALVQSAEPGKTRFRIRSPKLAPEGLQGTLLRVDPASVAATRMLQVWIELGPEAALLAIGELVEVIPEEGGEAWVTLPLSALGGGERPFVWQVREAEGRRTLHRLDVTTEGPAGPDRLRVSGIAPGTEVVTRGVSSLQDGQQVGPALPHAPALPEGPLPLSFGEN